MLNKKINEDERNAALEEKNRIKALQEEYREEYKLFQTDYDAYRDTVLDFQKKLSVFMKKAQKTAEKIAEEVGIQPETLSRYRNGVKAPGIETLVAICVALHLDIKQSQELFNSLGYSFLGTSKEHYAYIYLIEKHRGKSVSQCNEILTGLGIDIDFQLYPDRNEDKIRIKKTYNYYPSLGKAYKLDETVNYN